MFALTTKLIVVFSIMIFSQFVNLDGNNLTTKMTKAEIKKELIKQCPITIFEYLPYDYKQEYQEKLFVDIQFDLFRLIEVNDLDKS